MQQDEKFRVYIIKCISTGFCYFNYTGSQDDNFKPLQYIARMYKKEGKYKKLGESIKANKMDNHKCTVYQKKYTKDQAEEKIYAIHTKFLENFPNSSLNDLAPLDPEKEVCEFCNKRYRAALRDIHLEKYCDRSVFGTENELFKDILFE